MDRVLVSLHCNYKDDANHESPIIFIHGFPDSEHIFENYYCEEERKKAWLRGRNIFTISFTNRHTKEKPYVVIPANTNKKNIERTRAVSEDEVLLNNVLEMPPTLYELLSGLQERHFGAALLEVINESATGKVVLVAHDWGATHTWKFLKEYEDIANECIEFFVSLSVGSSFRYDIWEHGFKAILWAYNVLFSLPYYFPSVSFIKKGLHFMLKHFAGYQHETAPNEYDCWHYWFAPFRLIKLPWLIAGFGIEKEFLDIPFPVLFIRATVDSIASTRKFEKELKERADCVLRVKNFKSKHFFPQHEVGYVLNQVQEFHHMLDKLGYFDLINISTQTMNFDFGDTETE